MRFSKKDFANYIDNAKEKIIGKRLLSPMLYNSHSLYFPLDDHSNFLFVSLSKNNPFFQIGEIKYFPNFETFSNDSFSRIRSYIKEFIINDITCSPNDLIVLLSGYEVNLQKELILIFELFPLGSNFYVANNNYQILETFYNQKNNGSLIGRTYCFPNNDTQISKNEHRYSKETINNLFSEEIKIRENEKYSSFIKIVTNHINRAKRKEANLFKDIFVARKNLKLIDDVNEIYTLNLNLKSHVSEIQLNDKLINLDKSITLKENIDKLINKYKKAKTTILVSEDNLLRCRNDYNFYSNLLNTFNDAKSEKEKDKIISNSGLIKNSHPTLLTPYNRPYKINKNGVLYYFGKNASQNDYLSFIKKFDRDFTYLHIKNKSGAHIIIAKRKPTQKELIFAAEIALICSKVTSAEVIYTLKKNVKKGKKLGEVILKNYSVIKINNISSDSYEYVKNAERIKD